MMPQCKNTNSKLALPKSVTSLKECIMYKVPCLIKCPVTFHQFTAHNVKPGKVQMERQL